MELEPIRVQTKDQYRGDQEPTLFEWRGKEYRVSEVLDRWYEGHPDPTRLPLRYFKVETDEGFVFILRHHELFRAWSILIAKAALEQ